MLGTDEPIPLHETGANQHEPMATRLPDNMKRKPVFLEGKKLYMPCNSEGRDITYFSTHRARHF